MHLVFGKMLLFQAKKGAYWEAEPMLAGEPFSVAIETTGDAPPSDAQVHFYELLTSDPDATFARAKSLLVPEYEEWMKAPFPANWRTAFKFVGMSVPMDGDESNAWDLSFDCLTDKSGHMFTCYFEEGQAKYVTIDG